MRFFLCLLLAFSATHCGVEAGNAGGVKSKTGNVKVLFAQQQASGSESATVQIGSLGLLSSDDSEVATLKPSVASVDLYGSSSSESILVAEGTSVPTGSYAKIAIRMTGDRPVRYRDEAGTDHDVNLDDETKAAFYFVQDIKISENGTTTIVLNIDPYKSVQRSGSDNKFVFKPYGDAANRGEEVRYKNTTTVANARWICAYAYDLPQTRPNSDRNEGGRGDDFFLSKGPGSGDGTDGMGAMPPPGRQTEGRPTFGNKGELVKDTSSSCENAFAKAPVFDGKFEFGHLRAGTYALRVFTSTGTYSDIPDDITLPEDD